MPRAVAYSFVVERGALLERYATSLHVNIRYRLMLRRYTSTYVTVATAELRTTRGTNVAHLLAAAAVPAPRSPTTLPHTALPSMPSCALSRASWHRLTPLAPMLLTSHTVPGQATTAPHHRHTHAHTRRCLCCQPSPIRERKLSSTTVTNCLAPVTPLRPGPG